MQLKVQHVFDATLVVARIINENRPMPQKGKYRLARLHAKLLPEFTTIAARRDEMITAFDHVNESAVPTVPPDKMAEFNAAWAELGNEVIEVDVEPIPLACLDLGDAVVGTIQAAELIALGELVTE